jgi:hypothetical protein
MSTDKAKARADSIITSIDDAYRHGEWSSGCGCCPADVELVRPHDMLGAVHAKIFHEPWCKELAWRERRERTRAQRREAARNGCP